MVSIWHNTVVMAYHYTAPMAVIVGSVMYITTLYFPLSLLIFLVMRLHITFKNTAFVLSQSTYSLFGVIFVLLFLIPLSIPIMFILSHDLDDDNYELDADAYPVWFLAGFSVAYFSYWIVYTIGAALAVYHFVHNLRLLAKTQHEHDSPTSGSHSSPKEVKLNKNQQRASDLAARYLLLFAVAIGSDFLNLTLSYSFSMMTICIWYLSIILIYLSLFQFPRGNRHPVWYCLLFVYTFNIQVWPRFACYSLSGISCPTSFVSIYRYYPVMISYINCSSWIINFEHEQLNTVYTVHFVVHCGWILIQFGFAEEHYNGYCGCLDRPAVTLVRSSTQRYISRSMSRTAADMSDIPSASPSIDQNPSNTGTSQVTMSIMQSDDDVTETADLWSTFMKAIYICIIWVIGGLAGWFEWIWRTFESDD